MWLWFDKSGACTIDLSMGGTGWTGCRLVSETEELEYSYWLKFTTLGSFIFFAIISNCSNIFKKLVSLKV